MQITAADGREVLPHCLPTTNISEELILMKILF
jgi:hypothetical protein